MTPRHLRLMLHLGSAGFVTACFRLGAYAVFAPLTTDVAATPTVRRPDSGLAETSRVADPTAAELAAVGDIRLRSNRPAAAPVVATPVAPPPAPLHVRLVGTIVEPGRSAALFVGPQGAVELKQVGEAVGSAKLSEVEDGRVILHQADRRMTLELPPRKELP
jgi:hypothetical protein